MVKTQVTAPRHDLLLRRRLLLLPPLLRLLLLKLLLLSNTTHNRSAGSVRSAEPCSLRTMTWTYAGFAVGTDQDRTGTWVALRDVGM